jgi:hypothetical protein
MQHTLPLSSGRGGVIMMPATAPGGGPGGASSRPEPAAAAAPRAPPRPNGPHSVRVPDSGRRTGLQATIVVGAPRRAGVVLNSKWATQATQADSSFG